MTPDQLAKDFDSIYSDIKSFRASGHKEYASDSNAFSNFESLAKELGISREQVLWTYAMKHKDGIASYLRGNISQREPVQGRIKDLIVYLFILHSMIDENDGLLPDVTTKDIPGQWDPAG